MKKFITVFILLSILAFPAFAQLSFSGIVGAGATILKGTINPGGSPGAGGFLWGRLQVNAQNEKGTLGALLRIKVGMDVMDNHFSWSWYDPNDWANVNPYAWAWWKPVEQFKIQLGFIDDFAVSEIVAWGFNGNDAEDYIALAGYDYTSNIFHRATGFYNGTWWTGASISVKPIPELAINLAIPYQLGNKPGKTAADVYLRMHGQITYTIQGIGRAALSFEGKGDGKLTPQPIWDTSDTPFGIGNANASTLYASFYLRALEQFGIGLNAGFAYTLPSKDSDISYYSPMAMGLGFSFDRGKFGVRLRMAASFAGKAEKEGSDTYKEPFKLGIGVNPSYDFGVCKVFFNAGISFTAKNNFENGSGLPIENPSAFGWHLNPYVTKRIGPGTIYGGFQLESDASNNKMIRWGIPIAVQFEL